MLQENQLSAHAPTSLLQQCLGCSLGASSQAQTQGSDAAADADADADAAADADDDRTVWSGLFLVHLLGLLGVLMGQRAL